MKIRSGFVSNSSSCSFTLPMNMVSPKIAYCILYDIDKLAEYFEYKTYGSRGWTIKQVGDNIEGDTIMDNFGMLEFFEKIGIDISKITYDDDNLGSNKV